VLRCRTFAHEEAFMLRFTSSVLTFLLLLLAGVGPAAAEYPERSVGG
jgi:hypothetical protein